MTSHCQQREELERVKAGDVITYEAFTGGVKRPSTYKSIRNKQTLNFSDRHSISPYRPTNIDLSQVILQFHFRRSITGNSQSI